MLNKEEEKREVEKCEFREKREREKGGMVNGLNQEEVKTERFCEFKEMFA